jgi:hypothetical protein
VMCEAIVTMLEVYVEAPMACGRQVNEPQRPGLWESPSHAPPVLHVAQQGTTMPSCCCSTTDIHM